MKHIDLLRKKLPQTDQTDASRDTELDDRTLYRWPTLSSFEPRTLGGCCHGDQLRGDLRVDMSTPTRLWIENEQRKLEMRKIQGLKSGLISRFE